MSVHGPDDPANGSALCPDCYDWTSAVIWQWWAPELWRRTTIALRRALAAALGVPESRLGEVASLQYAKVAEYQTRGLVHFHALIRLDGPDGPGSPAPLDGARSSPTITEHAARGVHFTAPAGRRRRAAPDPGVGSAARRPRGPRTGTAPTTPTGRCRRSRSPATWRSTPPRTPTASATARPPRPHLIRLAATCRDLAERARAHDPFGSEYRLLGKWAHMLGFRGHFSTKSRRYSITLGRLRRARQRFQALTAEARRAGEPLDVRDLEARLLADDDDTTLVIGSWGYQGTGWTQPGDQALALAAAARAREYDQWRAEQRKSA